MFWNNTVSFQWTSQKQEPHIILRVYNFLWLASVDYGLLFQAVMPEIVQICLSVEIISRTRVILNSFTQPFQQSPASSACQWTPLRKRKVGLLFSRFCSTFDKVCAKVLSLLKAQSALVHFFSSQVIHQTTNQTDFFCCFPLFTDTNLLRPPPALNYLFVLRWAF